MKNAPPGLPTDVGFATPESEPLLLPRMLDVSSLSDVEFEAWLSGVAAVVPRRKEPAAYRAG